MTGKVFSAPYGQAQPWTETEYPVNAPKGRILFVDGQPDPFRSLSAMLARDGYEVIPSNGVEHASRIVHSDDVDAVVADLALSNGDGLRLLDYIAASKLVVPIIFLTARETIEVASQAMTRGAFCYFIKPPDYPQLVSMLARAVEQSRMKREIELLKERLSAMTPAYHIIGNSQEMRKTIEVLEAVKVSSGNVLIWGETGTGKGLIAKHLHSQSNGGKAQFVTVKCGAMPWEFMEAELFGCAKSSFARPPRDRGRLEEIGDGVLFLDEIDHLGQHTQARLLQLLCDGDGGGKAGVHFRLISSTTADLLEKVRAYDFNEELYRKVSEIEIKVPPLRERKDDIPLLASAFLNEACTTHKRKLTLSGEVMKAFQYHDWPGNVRQLKNVVERAVSLARGNRITLRELTAEFLSPKKRSTGKSPVRTLKQLEMQAIRETLRKCNGNKSRTARMLGISRKAFYKRLREADQFRNA